MNTSHLIATVRRYLTLNNSVLLVAMVIVVASIWNTMLTLQKNFLLQQQVNTLEQEIMISQLEVDTLRLQQQYLQSPEYQELTAREKLGKAAPGESVVNLPPLPPEPEVEEETFVPTDQLTNFQKWMRFFFGR
jgi:cell division protein FtsB